MRSTAADALKSTGRPVPINTKPPLLLFNGAVEVCLGLLADLQPQQCLVYQFGPAREHTARTQEHGGIVVDLDLARRLAGRLMGMRFLCGWRKALH